ncbi:MAG: FtsQ-type POTRA domain-containing protein [Gemmatimonadota bacterium]|nr:FtsQ-type POTRA domain-containing protein [Gemmatimonadota bacterium]
MRRLLRWGAPALLVVAAGAAVPWLLPRMPGFEVARVEVSGTRLLAPHVVLAASGVQAGHSVWADPGEWEAALLRNAVIERVEIRRRLPHTLRIRVVEKQPTALVDAGALRPATGAGELLPVDPALASVDLPLLHLRSETGSGAEVRDPGDRAALAELHRLSQLDPLLLAGVSEVRGGEEGELLLSVAEPSAEIRLPFGADKARLGQLRAALDVLARQSAGASAAPPAPLIVDLRFRDQIVVRLPSRT